MTAGSEIDFWFSIGSTYTYLTVSRLNHVEADKGIRFRWWPFGLRAILQEMDNIPFATKPIKLAYMWRDVERRASLHGLAISVPAPTHSRSSISPIASLLPARRKDGARLMSGPPTGAGSRTAWKRAASRTCQRA